MSELASEADSSAAARRAPLGHPATSLRSACMPPFSAIDVAGVQWCCIGAGLLQGLGSQGCLRCSGGGVVGGSGGWRQGC